MLRVWATPALSLLRFIVDTASCTRWRAMIDSLTTAAT
jgi:hypothetical protein